MSKVKVYTRDEFNKKILAKENVVHGERELVGQLNGYRNEEYELYNYKRDEFLTAASAYKVFNKSAMYTNKIKLDSDADNILRYYGECICEAQERCEKCYDTKNVEGTLIRKRSYRHIHDDKFENIKICTLEPWFARYLKLCKFIYAARTIILHNRLLNNLRILKTWAEHSVEALEKQQPKPIKNVSYSHLFEKFIN